MTRKIPSDFAAPTERTPSRESAGNGPSGRGHDDRWGPGGLRSLAAVAGRKLASFARRRRSGRPPGNRPAMAHPVVANDDREDDDDERRPLNFGI